MLACVVCVISVWGTLLRWLLVSLAAVLLVWCFLLCGLVGFRCCLMIEVVRFVAVLFGCDLIAFGVLVLAC